MNIDELLREKQVVVCCGAGGVGKTTVSASLAVAAARMGRRVLVITIDPSKRLAETLGVSRNPVEPVEISGERLTAIGVEPPGSLAAWMLDPGLVADSVVKRFSKSKEEERSLLGNRMYKNISSIVAGMQEYTAVQALYEFVKSGKYDLIILDTPPSRDALRFLEAPSRASGLLDLRVFSLFMPGERNVIRRAASALLEKVMDLAFGVDTRKELQLFLSGFSAILARLKSNVKEMQDYFKTDKVAFLLVTSPAEEALLEARHFERKAKSLDLPVAGYVLNSSMAFHDDLVFPRTELLGVDPSPDARSALEKLRGLAEIEEVEVNRHRELLTELRGRATAGIARALPRLPDAVSDLTAVRTLADALVAAT